MTPDTSLSPNKITKHYYFCLGHLEGSVGVHDSPWTPPGLRAWGPPFICLTTPPTVVARGSRGSAGLFPAPAATDSA